MILSELQDFGDNVESTVILNEAISRLEQGLFNAHNTPLQ